MSISRLNWSDANPKNSRSRTSSTSSDADNTEIGESPSRFLYLDQSSADLFMNYGAENDENIDEHLVNKKRRVTTPVPGDNKSVEVDQDDDASALPPSSLMAFTPSSLSLVCVDASSQQIICRALDTGSEIWRFAFPASEFASFISYLILKPEFTSGLSSPLGIVSLLVEPILTQGT